MMNILYYDCFAGISGDMNLAALIGLGVEPDYLRAELSKLGLDHEFELRVSVDARHGIHGTRVDVLLADRQTSHGRGHAHGHEEADHEHHGHAHGHRHGHDHSHSHGHEHGHTHGHEHTHEHGHDQEGLTPKHEHALVPISEDHAHHHSYFPEGHTHCHAHGQEARTDRHGHDHGHVSESGEGHGHEHAHEHEHHHEHEHAAHRNLAAIEGIITGSSLSPEVKNTSLAIFRKVAEAEAKVHGKPINEVHFHEVGATDSIVDIVGAAICLHRLGVDEVWSSPVELGGGFVRCAHGLVPVPAPATVEILQGIPTTRGAVKQETTTPTGAAILAALVDEFTETPALVMDKTAYGIGHRQSDIPNVLRVHLAHPALPRTVGTVQAARLLQCNIDDMSGEMLGATMDLLMEQGAMDVHFTPIQMKKNRPATCVSLLCAAADEERYKQLLFRHTTTLGVKSFPLDKTVLEISFERLETPLGPVTMKNALQNGKVIRSKPELEDCREMARRNDMTLTDVYALIGKHRA